MPKFSKKMWGAIGLFVLALIQVTIGYGWLQSANTSDFNFGPPFIIMSGLVVAIVAVIWILYLVRQRK